MRRRTLKDKGQALIVFLGFAAAMVGLLLVAFNSGQVTNAKMRAMNAADAAAYSGAVWEARTLNFQAYMNRAMVVNEVTIAQSVSLRSWVDYIARFVTNINYITRFIPYAGTVTQAIQQVLSQVNTQVQNFLPLAEQGLRFINVGENVLQVTFNFTGPVAADLATKVANLNGATVSHGGNLLLAKNAIDFLNFTKDYNKSSGRVGTDGRTRLREVTLNSRDGFTAERDWSMGLGWVFEIRKQGGTDLIDFDAWKGLDSAELRTVYNPLKGDWTTKVPVGWGGAQAYNPNKVTKIGTHGQFNQWNDTDGRLARNDANNNTYAKKLNNPFPNYRDLADLKGTTKPSFKLAYPIEVVIPNSSIPSANSAFNAKAVLPNGTTLEHDPNFPANAGVYAIATGCVSFERPYRSDRVDGKTELPSLFSPYWRASLATDSRLTRTIVGAAKALPPIGALLGGNSTCS
ncbi:pilus assembly protein TadG-related protein [Undibacterium sp. RuTC16W]|uniref:pilus assembly protein TadG-related protein n=1 Tax=Undibacterium sp. RuTC16W TaxID=3413048 RepID=UPI003BF1BCD9